MKTESIKGYHLHTYFQDEESRARAVQLRSNIQSTFDIHVSEIFDERDMNDPHQRPMFIAFFKPVDFGTFVPWVMLHQNGLKMMIHPLTGQDYEDHMERAIWFSEVLSLNEAALRDPEIALTQPSSE